MSYASFHTIWQRTILVAGYPEKLQPYSLHVGAGSRLDGMFMLTFFSYWLKQLTLIKGVLSPALRNYLLPHSSDVFERSYQPRHIRENLMSSLEPNLTTKSDTQVFRLLRQASLRCDKFAPINPSKSDIARWKETRTNLRALLESKDYDKSNKVSCIIRSLSRQYIDDQRHQYFTESNRQRALGQTTEDLILAPPKGRGVSIHTDWKKSRRWPSCRGGTTYHSVLRETERVQLCRLRSRDISPHYSRQNSR